MWAKAWQLAINHTVSAILWFPPGFPAIIIFASVGADAGISDVWLAWQCIVWIGHEEDAGGAIDNLPPSQSPFNNVLTTYIHSFGNNYLLAQMWVMWPGATTAFAHFLELMSWSQLPTRTGTSYNNKWVNNYAKQSWVEYILIFFEFLNFVRATPTPFSPSSFRAAKRAESVKVTRSVMQRTLFGGIWRWEARRWATLH